MGAELIHADERKDGQTDITKLKFTFRSSANAPKSSSQDIRSVDRA